jgi:O-antigen/teichoic acid export membrane protein
MPSLPSDVKELHHTIARNISISLLANIFYLATRLFIPPIILDYVTLAEYGIWSYCFVFIGYLSMGVFGVSNVYVRYAAVFYAKGKIDQINRLISTGLISVGGICFLSLPILWYLLPGIIDLFNIPQKLAKTAFILIFGTILAFVVDLILNVFGYILQSLQKFVIEKSIWMLSFTIETLLILVFLYTGFGIYSLLFAYFARVFFAAFFYTIACYKVLPGLSIGYRYFDRSILTLFFHYGGIVQLTGILSTANRSIEKVLAGLFMGPSAAGLIDIGEKFPTTAINIPSAINAVILPTSAHMHAKDMHENTLELYLNGSRWVSILTGLMMGFLAPFASPLIITWLGTNPVYQSTAMILSCFTIAYQMDVLTGPASAIYRGINRPGRELVYSVFRFFLVLSVALLGLYFFGYTLKVIVFTVASMMIVSAFIYIYLCNQFLRVAQWNYVKKVLIPGFLPYFFGFALYFCMRNSFDTALKDRWYTFHLFLECWVIYVCAMFASTYWIICSWEERVYVRSKLKEIFKKS